MTPASAGAPAVFLDRDGVINQEVGYLIRPEDVRFVPGLFPLLRTARRLGYRLVVVTNQSGIARQLYTEEQFHELMRWMAAELRHEEIHLDAVYFCPYHPEHGVGDLRRDHSDRKPAPGMLLRAARELGLDLARSVIVGDRCSDLAAGRAAGLREQFLLRGTETGACPGVYRSIGDLAELEQWLVEAG